MNCQIATTEYTEDTEIIGNARDLLPLIFSVFRVYRGYIWEVGFLLI